MMIIGATICCLVLWLLKGTLLPMAPAVQFTHLAVIPAKAGTQLFAIPAAQEPASGLRMNDDVRVDKPKNSCFSNAMAPNVAAHDASGALSFASRSIGNATGTSVTNSDDDNGDGVYDRVQTIIKTANADGSRTDLATNNNQYSSQHKAA
jgi:hypothetical protein